MGNWISVKVARPDPYVEVWAWDASRKCGDTSWIDPHNDKNKGWLFGSYYKARVTHWMPLPPPPASDGRKGE